jgi:hypothetical protein
MKLLSLESLDNISDFLKNNEESTDLIDDFESAKHTLGLQYVDAGYDLNLDEIKLLVPTQDLDGKKGDALNCKIFYQALSNLSPAQATDDRLWVTLCFENFNYYVVERWKMPPKGRAKNIKSHWTFQGAKPLTRDNALSRLWWMGYIASQVEGWSMEEVFEILFNNSDYRQSLVDRSGSTSNVSVVSAILAITKEAFDNNLPFKRSAFRSFMESVNFISGRTHLAALDLSEVIAVLKPVYLDAYGVKSGGSVGKFFKDLGKSLKK